MALVLKDRVRQTSTTAGTGTITLSGSVTGYQDFTVIGTGNTTYYTIADQSGSNWEVGLGTYTAPNQLARTTVYESSNGNALVNFGSNIKDVFVTLPAEGFASPPAIGGTTPNTINGTTVSATTQMLLPTVTVGNAGTGILQMVDGLDGYDYLNIFTYDVGGNVQVKFPAGIQVTGNIDIGTSIYFGGYGLFVGGGGASGNIALRGGTVALDITIQAPASPASGYTLTLPTTAGSANQVLKTDGSGNLSWVNLNAPSIYTTASSQNSTTTALANITGLTATLAANTTYRVDCFVTFQSAATTTGINFGFTSPAGTTCMLEVVVPITNTAAASQLRTIFPNNSSTNTGSVLGTGVSAANNNHTARFSGIIKVGGTGGTFAAQYATEIASSAITIPAGSTMVIQQIS